MSERVLYPDEEQRRRIMDFIMAAGQTLLENGAEVFRVEQTMEIMARSFHLREFHVYILTNGIFASAGTAEISEVRNVPVRTTHLGRVAAAVAGLAASSYLLLCERLNLPGGFRKITTASLITLVCLPLCHLLGTEASHAIIGTLMILTPGIAFTMGIRDFVQGDYLSGTIRMIDALLVAACIAIGTGFVLWCYSLLTGVNIA